PNCWAGRSIGGECGKPAPTEVWLYSCSWFSTAQQMLPIATLKCRRDTGSALAPGAAHSLQPNPPVIM
ncbi:MAG TPA: hypothetical protein VGT44_22410, partial [Ktedonobacteraceae bacterium]|nr:hypothetical protein [Ktedonobacteraceae bacterium]